MSKVIDIDEHKKNLNGAYDVEISFIYGEGDICRALRKALNDAEKAQKVEDVFCDLLFADGEPCPRAARNLLADLLSRQDPDQ